MEWLDSVLDSPDFRLEAVGVIDFKEAVAMYRNYSDKAWSFTDCTSFVIMERLGLTKAFSFDEHFRQIGKFTVLP